ncbi:ParA family protein [Massilia sp. B-10]|nr:ParA family protein [Massilia sp. B-10]
MQAWTSACCWLTWTRRAMPPWALSINKVYLKASTYEVLLGEADVHTARQRSEAGRFDVLPSNRELGKRRSRDGGTGKPRTPPERCAGRGRRRIRFHPDRLPARAVDAHPERPVRAHGVIIPMQCEYYALEGLSDLVNTIKKVHANLNQDLKIIGLLRVMFDPRMTLSQQVSAQLEEHFGDKVFKTIIPRNVRLAEAPSYGIPGVTFDPTSKGAQAYVAFGAEMVKRIKSM